MANHIFISYAREDQPYARALADHLRQRGFDVWMDARIDFGDRWWQTIVQALRTSAAFIVVMAPESEKSEWVQREVLLALKERKPIFPLLLRGRRFPTLVDRQYADVTGGRMPPDDFCDRLRQVLSAHKVSWPAPVQEKKPPTLVRHYSFQPEMVLIPAGTFRMGSDPARDKDAKYGEQPRHTLYRPDYYIARTPITNAQYAVFVKDTGYATLAEKKGGWDPRTRKYTKGFDWRHPRGPGTSFEDLRDHPVVQVSWHDALAYCRWLTKRTGRRYRLPSEAEWEKAARGTDGRIYPWGNEWDAERCNSREGSKRGTTPVGAYPTGASPYGLLDMAGNVWEWTRSLYCPYPYDPDDGRENLDPTDAVHRVLRGGAFVGDERSVRCARRLRNPPFSRGGIFGFRWVASPVYL